MNNRAFGRGRLLIAAALLTLLVQGSASATPLNLTSGTPDITASFLNFLFDANGGVCGAGSQYTLCFSGDPAFISSYGLDPEISDAVTYQLVAAVDPLTGLLTPDGGMFSMGSYLAGDIVGFGYEIAGGAAVFEFLVGVTSGTLAAPGSVFGINAAVFDWGSVGFGSSLTTVTSIDAMTDNFATPIPEPATLCLLGLGLFALSAARVLRRT